MTLAQGVSRLPRRVHRRAPALLDRLEIWDTPVTARRQWPCDQRTTRQGAEQTQADEQHGKRNGEKASYLHENCHREFRRMRQNISPKVETEPVERRCCPSDDEACK